ncbi:hypothetical protein [Actinacidiphila reveromycinica]|nr:hypothetical protein [Streptomyces sp. SN-593]
MNPAPIATFRTSPARTRRHTTCTPATTADSNSGNPTANNSTNVDANHTN